MDQRQLDGLRRFGDLYEFIEAVADCRYNQRMFFKTRQNKYLQESKRSEKRVDELLEKIWPSEKPKPGFGNLFNTNEP